MSKTNIIARIRPDGAIVQVMEDGRERSLPDQPARSMTEGEVEAAADADPDARPMTREQMAGARRIARVRTMRRALMLTQAEFAARFHIPLGTVKDWEQGRSEPDQTATAYLTVIASDPDAVARALSLMSR